MYLLDLLLVFVDYRASSLSQQFFIDLCQKLCPYDFKRFVNYLFCLGPGVRVVGRLWNLGGARLRLEEKRLVVYPGTTSSSEP